MFHLIYVLWTDNNILSESFALARMVRICIERHTFVSCVRKAGSSFCCPVKNNWVTQLSSVSDVSHFVVTRNVDYLNRNVTEDTKSKTSRQIFYSDRIFVLVSLQKIRFASFVPNPRLESQQTVFNRRDLNAIICTEQVP